MVHYAWREKQMPLYLRPNRSPFAWSQFLFLILTHDYQP